MDSSIGEMRDNRRLMARTAAAICGAGAIDGLVEAILPGGQQGSIVSSLIVLGLFFVVLTVGHRVPRRVLGCLGPVGVGLIALALGTTSGVTDGAVLFALPVLWQTLFFGRRGAVLILTSIAVADALALLAVPHVAGSIDRWIDVMMCVSAIAFVVLSLERRNRSLLARLTAEARIDPLTGLLNRRGFDERAAVELARTARDPVLCAIATFDIDHFKRVNDEWGHDVGDQVLSHVSRVLLAEARQVDVLARFGGEEFVVLMPGSGVDGARAFADRVRDALGPTPDGLPSVRVSAGVTAGPHGSDPSDLLREADAALYRAKRTGRDRTLAFAAAA